MSFIGDAIGGIFGGGSAARRAAGAQSEGAQAGIDEQRRQFDLIQGLMAPQIEAGDMARQQQLALLGLLGPEAQAQAQSQFSESPGQKFIRERQQRALVRNSAATGGLGGGNVQTALQQQAAGFASQDFGNQFNRLAGLSGSGQAATGNLGQFGQASAGNIANLLGQQGQAQASGILGQQQANAGLAGNLITTGLGIAGLFSDKRLKKDIKKIGSMGKLDLFSWVWRNTGEKDTGFIAQQVQKIFPEYVVENNGFLMVDYEKAIEAAKWA